MDTSNQDRSSEAVGYGNPPKAHQFKKGQSGNPRGRPRKPKPETMDELIQRALDEKVTVKIGGKTRRMTRREVIVERHVADLLTGKKGAAKAMQDLGKLPAMKKVASKDSEYINFSLHPDSILPALDLLAKELEAGE